MHEHHGSFPSHLYTVNLIFIKVDLQTQGCSDELIVNCLVHGLGVE